MAPSLRRLASDTVVYGVSTILQRFLTFLLTPLYSNYLTPSELGEVTAVFSVIAFVNIAYSLGMEPAFMRFHDKNDAAASATAFSNAVRSVVVLGSVMTGLTFLFAENVATSRFLALGPESASLVRLACFIPLFDALVLIPFARLRMQQRPRRFAALRLVSVVANVVLNVILLQWYGQGVSGVIIAGVASSLLVVLLMVPDLAQGLRQRGNRATWQSMVRFGLPTVPSSMSTIIVQLADRPLLLMMAGSATVGLFQTNFRLALPMMMMVTVFEYAWKPFYLNHRDEPGAAELFARVLTLFTVACGCIFLATSLLMPSIVALPFGDGTFINSRYWDGLSVVPIALFAFYLNGVFTNLAAGFHIARRPGIFPVAMGLAAVINVAGTLALVRPFGLDGAAWAKVIAYAASVVVLVVKLPSVYTIRYEWGRVLVAVAVAGLLYFVARGVTTGWVAVSVGLLIPLLYVLVLIPLGVVNSSIFAMIPRLMRR
jgi:O-antigen/teichoic acid export membrane protein